MSELFNTIHDKRYFASYKEHQEFEEKISMLIKDGVIEERTVDEARKLGEKRLRWLYDKAAGEIYRYNPPDFPAKGNREKVR